MKSFLQITINFYENSQKPICYKKFDERIWIYNSFDILPENLIIYKDFILALIVFIKTIMNHYPIIKKPTNILMWIQNCSTALIYTDIYTNI